MFRWDIKPPTDADHRRPASRRRGLPRRRRRPAAQPPRAPARSRRSRTRTRPATQRHHLSRRVPAVARTRSLPGQPERPAPEVLRHRHRRRAVVHHVLGEPRGPPVPPVQLVHQDRRPGPLRASGVDVLRPPRGAEPARRRRAGGTTAARSWSNGSLSPPRSTRSRSDLLLSTLRDISCTRGARDVSAMIAVIQRADVRAQLARLSDPGAGCAIAHLARHRGELDADPRCPAATSRTRLVQHRPDPRQDARRPREVPRHARPHLVVTGTSNTTCGGLLYNDEVMLRVVDNRWLHDQYARALRRRVRPRHQSRSRVMPVMKPCRR